MKRVLLSLLLISMSLMGFAADQLKFSKKHGFCDTPFELTIKDDAGLATGTAQIRYTLDGSEPTAESRLYSAPIMIDHNTIIRAAVVDNGERTSVISTATYLFLDDVLRQPDNPVGYPSVWGRFAQMEGEAPADYGMDQEMTTNPQLAKKIKEGLTSLPVLSIVTDKDNLFSHENDPDRGGIYIFTGPPVGDPTGNGWTRPANAELFGMGHDFSVTCGLRLHGGHGRLAEKNPKHSMRLVFKKEYGEKSLKYNLFGKGEPDKFDQLVLRCHFGNSWQHWAEDNRQKAQYTRDVWARRMQRKMGWTSVNALYVHLFLNGMYWGLYNIAERVNDQYGKDHLGGNKEDIDVVKIEEEGGNHHEAAEGTLDAWDLMVETAQKATDDAYYYKLQGKDAQGNDDPEQEALLDIDAFIDYMLINQYGGNNDWDHHNWYAIRKKGADSQGFRFLCWDSELVIENPQINVINKNNGSAFPTGIFHNLLGNRQFALRYLQRAKTVLSDDGLLGQKSVEAVWDSLYNNISTALYAEAARWGDYRRDVHPYSSRGSLYTVDGTYMAERNRLHRDFFPSRTAFVLDNIVSYLAIDDFEPQEGWVALQPNMFHKWDGSGADAKPLDTSVFVDWNMQQNSGGGVAIAGFVNVDHDTFADLSDYEAMVIRGKGSGLRILANRLVPHGSWKQLIVSFNENDRYWNREYQAVVVPLDVIRTMDDTDKKVRVDAFVHLDALKVDWGSTLNVSSVWLIPSAKTATPAIHETATARSAYHDGQYRTLQGQVVTTPSHGVYIYNGKKVIR